MHPNSFAPVPLKLNVGIKGLVGGELPCRNLIHALYTPYATPYILLTETLPIVALLS